MDPVSIHFQIAKPPSELRPQSQSHARTQSGCAGRTSRGRLSLHLAVPHLALGCRSLHMPIRSLAICWAPGSVSARECIPPETTQACVLVLVMLLERSPDRWGWQRRLSASPNTRFTCVLERLYAAPGAWDAVTQEEVPRRVAGYGSPHLSKVRSRRGRARIVSRISRRVRPLLQSTCSANYFDPHCTATLPAVHPQPQSRRPAGGPLVTSAIERMLGGSGIARVCVGQALPNLHCWRSRSKEWSCRRSEYCRKSTV